MNKKVLSSVLVASMLASSVGAMNVFASTGTKAPEAFTAYTPATASSAVDFGSATTNATLVAELDKVYTGDAEMNLEVANTTVYLFDYVAKGTGANEDGKLNSSAVSSTGLEEGADIKASLIDMITTGYGVEDDAATAYGDKLAALWTEFTTEYEIGGVNTTVKESFKEFADAAAALDSADYAEMYDDDDKVWDAYSLNDLKTAYKAANASLSTGSPAATSSLIYLYNSYVEIDDTIGLGRALSAEEKYNNLLDKIAGLNASDYTTTSWANLENKMVLADTYASLGDFATANSTLETAIAALKVNKPSVDALEGVLASLFTNGQIPATYATYAGTTEANCVYLKKNNGDTNPTQAWQVAFADTYTSYGETFTGAYKAAYVAWHNVKKRANSGKNTQTKIDALTSDLETALSALSEGNNSQNWELVRLEDQIAAAYKIVETDYRTTRTAWTTFEKALAAAEEVAGMSDPSASRVNLAYTNLVNAMNGLSSIKLTPSADNKTELKNLLKEAETLLKDTDGKTLTQVDNLKAAQKAGNDVYYAYNSQLISKVDSTIADLNKAIAGYKQAQGWYKDANGTWFYGKEDTVAKGWLNVNGVWYLLDSTTGAMKTGWQMVNGTWYYMDASGAMKTGWLNLNGTYYYLESWGGMATGWKNVNGTWYYLQGNGSMIANGWYWINGKCYYFYNWGGMAANTTINGYKVDASGAWVK